MSDCLHTLIFGGMPTPYRYVDLVNHQSYVGSEYGVDTFKPGWYQCMSSEAYEKGAEVYISYGSHHHTSHFLETYGFMPTGFDHMDVVGFHMPLRDKKDRGCRRIKHSQSTPEFCAKDIVMVAGVDGCLLPSKGSQALRRVAAEVADVEDHEVSNDVLARGKSFISHAIRKQLALFPQTYEEDAGRLVSGESLTFNEYAVLSVRSRYKRILKAVAERLDASDANDTCETKEWLYASGISNRANRAPGSNTDSWLYKMSLVPQPPS